MTVFFVGVDADATKVQRDAFTMYLRKQPVGFWHHVSHSWLISTSSPNFTAATFRQKLQQLMPGITTVVVKAVPQDYATYSPKTGHKWLQNYIGGRG